MTPHIEYLKPPLENTTKYDEYHRIRLYQQQKLWEGRFITHEKKRPMMLKIVIFNQVK